MRNICDFDFMRGVSLACMCKLSTEAVQRATLSLECIHDIHGSNSLALRVLAVGDRITNDVLEEDLHKNAHIKRGNSSESAPSVRHVSPRR